MKYKTTNAYYLRNLCAIGGIESHFFYIAQKYGKYDITVFCKQGDKKQIERLSKLVRVIKLHNGDTIECDTLFCCFNKEVLDFTTAKHKYLVIHGDYKSMVELGQLQRNLLPIDERFTGYLGVSQTVCDKWEELTGLKATNVYQPVMIEKASKPLLFCTASRLSREKGWERMKMLARAMNGAGINFTWVIYTNSPQTPEPNMMFMTPTLDITKKMKMFDAYIQLSDNEGYCLSVAEALKQGVPCIVTDLPVFNELGLTEENSVKLPLDMSYMPLQEIWNIHKKKFKWKEPEDLWGNFIVKNPTRYTDHVVVRATDEYKKRGIVDNVLGKVPEPDEEWTVTQVRLDELKEFESRTGVKLVEEQGTLQPY